MKENFVDAGTEKRINEEKFKNKMAIVGKEGEVSQLLERLEIEGKAKDRDVYVVKRNILPDEAVLGQDLKGELSKIRPAFKRVNYSDHGAGKEKSRHVSEHNKKKKNRYLIKR